MEPLKIAVIGSGIAGLYAAWRLSRQGHRVTLFERLASPGMAAHGFRLDVEGHTLVGDVPSRMFNAGLWPDVVRFYRELDIACEAVTVDQHYRTLGDQPGFGLTLPMALLDKLAVIANPVRRTIVAEAKRLRDEGLRQMQAGPIGGTFSDFLKRHGFGAPFTNEFLYPALSATVCTCSDKSIGNYPAEILLRGLEHITNPEGLYRVTEGSGEVVRRIMPLIDEVCCNADVRYVRQTESHAVVCVGDAEQSSAERSSAERSFEMVVIATQANHVSALCPDLAVDDKAIFAGFDYEHVRIDIHTDATLMPPAKRNWSTFNFVSRSADDHNHGVSGDAQCNGDAPSEGSMCTVWLNRFHRQWPDVKPVFQTIKPLFDPAAETLIQTIQLQRPVVNLRSPGRWSDIASLNRRSNRLKFCGSYAVPGIPLLQSAVQSAEAVIDTIEPARSVS